MKYSRHSVVVALRLPLLLAIETLGVWDGATAVTTLPSAANDLGMPESAVGNIMALHTVLLAIATPLFGRIGQRIGVTRLLIAGLSVNAAGALWSASASTGYDLFGARSLQALATGVFLPQALVLIQRFWLGPVRQRVIGYISSSVGIAIVAAPLTSGLLMEASSWRTPFSTLSAASAALAILASLTTTTGAEEPPPEPKQPPNDTTCVDDSIGDEARVSRWLILAGLSLSYVAGGSLPLTTSISILVRQETSATPVVAGVVLSAFGIGYALGGFTVARMGRAAGMTTAGVVMIGTHVLVAISTAIASPIVGIYVGWALLSGIAQSVLQSRLLDTLMRITPERQSGSTSGWWLFTTQVSNSAGLLIFATLLPFILSNSAISPTSPTVVYAALFSMVFLPVPLLTRILMSRVGSTPGKGG